MYKDKVFYFGYGDIAVGHFIGELKLTPFKPPQEIGNIVDCNLIEEEGETIKLSVTPIELFMIEKVFNKQITKFEIGDYTLDFTNYNEKSIQVVYTHIKQAICNNLLCLAC